jgi:hypothetical protein
MESGPLDTVNHEDLAVRDNLNTEEGQCAAQRSGAKQTNKQRSGALMSKAELLMRVVKAALESTGKVMTVELLGKSYGMPVALAWIRAEDFLYMESLLMLAKNTLLCASAAAEEVCILGNSLEPFTQRPHGFSVVLAEMPVDVTDVCWDAYRKGCCCRGHSCRWQHPQHTVELSVAFAVGTGA